jgi:hypothetical protein
MRKSIETYAELCDQLCSTACYTTCARRLGVSPASVFRWLSASAKTPDDYTFEWAGETLPLHQHARRAIRIQAAAVEGYARHRALHGSDEGVFYQGRPMWKVREDIARAGDLDADANMLELLYGQRDVYQRDAMGNRIQETIHHHPSDGLVNMVLKAHLPKLYGTKVEMGVTHQGGVLVVGASAPRPAPVAAPIQPMRLEPPEIDGEFTEVEHTELADLDPEALRAGYDPDDDIADDMPEPPRPQAPRPQQSPRDRSMIDSVTGIREGLGSGPDSGVVPGGYRVR